MSDRNVRVSVVICTRNRPDKIGQAVTSVLAVDRHDFELLIIDQSTDTATEDAVGAIAADDPRVRYQHMDAAGLSRAYNAGIAGTTGDIIAFTDDDCVVPTDWLDRIVAAFGSEPDADLLYGQVRPLEEGAEGLLLTPFFLIDEPVRLSRRDGFRVAGMGANFAARRRLFETVGPFDEALGGGGPLKSAQDYDLAYRAYLRESVIILRPEVSIRHDGRREMVDWPSLLDNYGFGDGAFYSKHVRCRDPYALWLLTRKLGGTSAKYLAKLVLRRKPSEGRYVRGMVRGIRGGWRFTVDRDTRLYGAPRGQTR